MDNSRCVILVPTARYIEPHCEFSLRQLEAQGYTVRRLHGFSQVDVARNRLASEALADGFEELMWIDSDIAFEPSSVHRLRGTWPARRLRPLSQEGRKRVVVPVPARPRLDHDGRRRRTHRDPLRRRGLPARAAGACSIEVQRHQQLPACRWRGGPSTIPFFLPMIVASAGVHTYLGEDFAFCERVRRCGIRIMADTSIRLQHIGMYGYGWEDVAGGVARSPPTR